MSWPFRPNPHDLDRIERDVSRVSVIQQEFLATDTLHLRLKDRVAHQYQIAGCKALLRIKSKIPDELDGVSLFEPDSEYVGIGRISTGFGCPHAETRPDFLGLRLAFQTRKGARVDFIAINDPTSPTDTHVAFMSLLEATARGAGAGFVFSTAHLLLSLFRTLGLRMGAKISTHVFRQTLRTLVSTTAYQSYWTGVVEVGGMPGKFVVEPTTAENQLRPFGRSNVYLSEEWRERQKRGAIEFNLQWMPFIDEKQTSLVMPTKEWRAPRYTIGRVTFPRAIPDSVESQLWAALAAEMGANPGNWVSDRLNTIRQPSTEFEVARKIAYWKSQQGRNVLPETAYSAVFVAGTIGDSLATELKNRRTHKMELGHLDTAIR